MDVDGPSCLSHAGRRRVAFGNIFIRCPAFLLFGLATAALPLRAGSNLLEHSPFLPPGAAAGAGQEASSLELRGIVKDGPTYEFSLYDSARRQSTWVGLNEPGHDFLVKAFDPALDAITVEQHGRAFKLVLKDARITPVGAPVGLRIGTVAVSPLPPATLDQDTVDSMSLGELRRRRAQLTAIQALIDARMVASRNQASSSPTTIPPASPPRSQ